MHQSLTGLKILLALLLFQSPWAVHGSIIKTPVFGKIVQEANSSLGIIEDFRRYSEGYIWIAKKRVQYGVRGREFNNFCIKDIFILRNNVITNHFYHSKEKLLTRSEYSLNLSTNNENLQDQVNSGIDAVHPPFYRTFWFVGFVIIAIIVLILGIYRLRVQGMKAINIKLSELVAERTEELQKSNREIKQQNEEIKKQRDIATSQRDQISKQNLELEKHRNQLEELVKVRTMDLAEAKLKAEESDRLKTAFLENLSHQIRTPMNAILGFINLLSEKIDDKISRDYYIRIINESGRSMLRLVEDIIDFSRMQTGHLKPEYAPCDIQRLTKDLITIFRSKASREKPNLNISMDFPSENIVINTDERKLTQVLMKLLENSYRYTENGHIRAGVSNMSEEFIIFYVEDSGIQIEQQHLEKIFDHLYVYSEQEKPDMLRGSGIDLAFAKTVTELLGGRIWAESNEKCNRFLFILPYKSCKTKAENKNLDKVKSPYRWPGKLIIVAEDEDSNFQLIEAMLRDTEVTILRANDGIHLLELVEKENHIDLVLLDIQMPRMNGINAMQIIRDSNKKLPVIAQTAFDQEHYRKKAKEQGFNNFIVKPIRKSDLLEAIQKCLG